jgi:hypothetical protein
MDDAWHFEVRGSPSIALEIILEFSAVVLEN